MNRAGCRRRTGALLLAALLVLSSACGRVPTIKHTTRSTALDKAVSTHAKMMRWGYYDEAAAYLRARDGSTIEPDLERIARYRVSSYDVINQLLADTGDEARAVALIEYYEIDSGVLKRLRDEQLWWYDTTLNRWFLASPLPAFGLAE